MTETPTRFASLAGEAAPEDILRDATRLEKLSAAAIERLGPLLVRCVLEPMTQELGELLSRYCLQHEAAEADLGHVVKVCRWLLRNASAMDLPVEALEADARLLWNDNDAIVKTLQEVYPPINTQVRGELLKNTLVKHGNVLTDVDWRVDYVASDRHTPRINAHVAMVTLNYATASGEERLTLQMTPDHLQRLAQVFSALAQKTAKGPRG